MYNENTLNLTLDTSVSGQLYRVCMVINKDALELSSDPQGIIEYTAGKVYNQLIDELGTLR